MRQDMGDPLAYCNSQARVDGEQDQDEDDERKNFAEEYDQCRSEITKFDNVLVDLRKYGFTLLTGITTAGSFLGFSAPARNIQFGVIVVTMVLVTVLYWLDIYYQTLIAGALVRSNILEMYLNRGLSLTISEFYNKAKLGGILHFLYIGFLTGLLLLGLFVIGIDNVIQFIFYGISMSNENTNTFTTLLIGYGFTLYAIIVIYVRSDRAKTKLRDVLMERAKEQYEQQTHNYKSYLKQDFAKDFRLTGKKVSDILKKKG